MEFYLFLPQMRMSFDRLVETAQAAEAAGFVGMAGMDHLVTAGAETQPSFEAMVTNTWIAAKTEKLKVSSLVLCDAFRHPAVLARQAVSLDHASGGRFELGIGWGSVSLDFENFGVSPAEPKNRVQRLRETLDVLKALWAGETVEYNGEFHKLKNAFQAPTPMDKIPIIIGGSGPKTLALVRDYADWWNLDIRHLDKYVGAKFEELRSQVGNARVSIQQMISFVSKEEDRACIAEVAKKRFYYANPVIGMGPELVDHFGKMTEQGVERVYLWFCDFAQPDSLKDFGEQVISKMS